MSKNKVKSTSFLFDVNDPYFADLIKDPLPKTQRLKEGIQSFARDGDSLPVGRKHPRRFLFQVTDLRFYGLSRVMAKWVIETFPSAVVEYRPVPGSHYMRRASTRNDGYATYVDFACKSQAMMFKLRWW